MPAIIEERLRRDLAQMGPQALIVVILLLSLRTLCTSRGTYRSSHVSFHVCLIHDRSAPLARHSGARAAACAHVLGAVVHVRSLNALLALVSSATLKMSVPNLISIHR